MHDVIDLWGPSIEALHPGLDDNFGKPLQDFSVGVRYAGKKRDAGNTQSDLMLDCLFGTNSPVRSTSAVRGAHIDSTKKLFTALLYLRDPDDDSVGGSYELYRIANKPYPLRVRKKIPARYVEKVKEVPYRANTLLMWLNSGLSVHGVSPRSITGYSRRYVNISAECYGGQDKHFFGRIRPEALDLCYRGGDTKQRA